MNQLEPNWLLKKINIRTKISPKISLNGDSLRISQIFRIIIDNSIKYSPESSLIQVIATENYQGSYNSSKEEGILIEVKDQGRGIHEKDIPFIFDRFYRASDVVNIQGTGLGLAIAQEIIKLHNGTINVLSSLDTGSIFSVFLPYKNNN